MPMVRPCTCGHAIEEHGHDPDYPGSTACIHCECIAYEADEDAKAHSLGHGEKIAAELFRFAVKQLS